MVSTRQAVTSSPCCYLPVKSSSVPSAQGNPSILRERIVSRSRGVYGSLASEVFSVHRFRIRRARPGRRCRHQQHRPSPLCRRMNFLAPSPPEMCTEVFLHFDIDSLVYSILQSVTFDPDADERVVGMFQRAKREKLDVQNHVKDVPYAAYVEELRLAHCLAPS
ncbi:hypothetical protein MTO96_034579 [Rhipicephalus appendiculatus]